MFKESAMVGLGLLVLCASQGWAGTSGNGWEQRQTEAGLPAQNAKTQYAFCYAGNPKVVYLTGVITLAPAESASKLNTAFGKYIMTTYGLPGFDRQRCVTAISKADAAAEKQRYLGMFGREQLIDTNWAGNSAAAD